MSCALAVSQGQRAAGTLLARSTYPKPCMRLAATSRPRLMRCIVRASGGEAGAPPPAPQLMEAERASVQATAEEAQAVAQQLASVSSSTDAAERSTAEAAAAAPAAPAAAVAAPPPQRSIAARGLEAGRDLLSGPLRLPIMAGAAFLGITFVIAVFRTVKGAVTPKAKRTRTIAKNKAVIDAISRYLPGNREGLSSGALSLLKLQTGFTSVEIMRKYLNYVLRERPFTEEAVDDLIHLKTVLGLSDEQVAEALRERAQRTYEKFGTVMLDTAGMSAAGIERKTASRSLFSKLLYLAECERFISREASSEGVDLQKIFGVTSADVDQLRMARLSES